MNPNVSDLSTEQLRRRRAEIKALSLGFRYGSTTYVGAKFGPESPPWASHPWELEWDAIDAELERRRQMSER